MVMLEFDSTQTKLTDYFPFIDKIINLTETEPDFNEVVENVDLQRKVCLDTCSLLNITDSFCPLFKKLVLNAQHNISKIPKTQRHNAAIKKFATSLLLYAGPMAYDLVHRNMPKALPCLRTVQREVCNGYQTIAEGSFQFDGLAEYLAKHGISSKVVSISEDATRIISRVDYDAESNRLVGFVLPCDDQGLPMVDSFLATSFQAMEEMFKANKRAKYAYVYMAQCLSRKVPPFCLGCIGTDNCFIATDVLNRWKYIYSQCKQRNISVVSFGSDGDSRCLRAMKISCQLNTSVTDQNNSAAFLTNKMAYPKDWTWFEIQMPTSIAYIQDCVHIAVKMKARLLKPSKIFPMGEFTAGIHHLQMVINTFAKDQHGLRHRDIDHKDRQNYEAALRITSPSVLSILKQLPDAKATLQYLQTLRNFIDGFLDKQLSPMERIQKIWYAVFFLRYWRRWLKSKKCYKLKNNFITSNAMSCIELNAHSLIVLIRTLRDEIPDGSNFFLPWLLGSQPCESTFRAARSMTGTFSTIVNFSLLGFLQRLHRLQILLQLETESSETQIIYPRVEKNLAKIGHSNQGKQFDLSSLTDDDIAKAVEEAESEALKSMNDLGMTIEDSKDKPNSKKVKNSRSARPHKSNSGNSVDSDDDDDDDDKDSDEDDDDDDDESDDDNKAENVDSVYSTEEAEAMSKEIVELNNDGVLENICTKLKPTSKLKF